MAFELILSILCDCVCVWVGTMPNFVCPPFLHLLRRWRWSHLNVTQFNKDWQRCIVEYISCWYIQKMLCVTQIVHTNVMQVSSIHPRTSPSILRSSTSPSTGLLWFHRVCVSSFTCLPLPVVVLSTTSTFLLQYVALKAASRGVNYFHFPSAICGSQGRIQRRQLLPLSFCNMWLSRRHLEASTTSTFLLQYVALKAESRGVNYFHFTSAICGSQGRIQRRQLLPLSFCNMWLSRQHLEASTTSTFLLQYVALKAESRGVNYFHFPSAICGSQGSIQRRQLLPLSFCNMWLSRQHLEASTTSTFLLQYVALKAASRGVNYFHFPSAICGSQGSIQRRQLLPLSFCNMWLSRQNLEASTTSNFLLQYVALKAASRGVNYFHFPSAICGSQGRIQRRQLLPLSFCNMWLSRQHLEVSTTSTFLLQYVALKAASRGVNYFHFPSAICGSQGRIQRRQLLPLSFCNMWLSRQHLEVSTTSTFLLQYVALKAASRGVNYFHFPSAICGSQGSIQRRQLLPLSFCNMWLSRQHLQASTTSTFLLQYVALKAESRGVNYFHFPSAICGSQGRIQRRQLLPLSFCNMWLSRQHLEASTTSTFLLQYVALKAESRGVNYFHFPSAICGSQGSIQRRQLLPLSFYNMWLSRQNLEASTTSTFLLQYVALKAASRGVNYFHFPSAICGSQGSIQRRQLLPLSFCNMWLSRQHLEASTTSTFLLQYVALKAASRGVNYFHFPSAIRGSQGSIQRRQLLPLSFCNMWLSRQHLEASTTSTFLLQYVALKAASRGVNYFHFPSAICGSQGSIQRRQLLPLSFCNMWLSRQHLEASTTSTFLLQYVALKAASRGVNYFHFPSAICGSQGSIQRLQLLPLSFCNTWLSRQHLEASTTSTFLLQYVALKAASRGVNYFHFPSAICGSQGRIQRRQLLPLSFCNMWLSRQHLEVSTTSTFLLQYVALKATSRGVNYFHFPSAICGSQGSIQRCQLLPLSFCNMWLSRQHLEASTTSTFLLQYVALKAASRGVNYFHFPSAICGSQGSIQRRQLLPLSFCNMWLSRQHLEASTTSTFLLQYVALKAASRGVNYFHFPSAICGSQGSIQRRQLLPLSFCNTWLSRQHLEVSTTSTFLLQYVAPKAASRGFNYFHFPSAICGSQGSIQRCQLLPLSFCNMWLSRQHLEVSTTSTFLLQYVAPKAASRGFNYFHFPSAICGSQGNIQRRQLLPFSFCNMWLSRQRLEASTTSTFLLQYVALKAASRGVNYFHFPSAICGSQGSIQRRQLLPLSFCNMWLSRQHLEVSTTSTFLLQYVALKAASRGVNYFHFPSAICGSQGSIQRRQLLPLSFCNTWLSRQHLEASTTSTFLLQYVALKAASRGVNYFHFPSAIRGSQGSIQRRQLLPLSFCNTWLSRQHLEASTTSTFLLQYVALKATSRGVNYFHFPSAICGSQGSIQRRQLLPLSFCNMWLSRQHLEVSTTSTFLLQYVALKAASRGVNYFHFPCAIRGSQGSIQRRQLLPLSFCNMWLPRQHLEASTTSTFLLQYVALKAASRGVNYFHFPSAICGSQGSIQRRQLLPLSFCNTWLPRQHLEASTISTFLLQYVALKAASRGVNYFHFPSAICGSQGSIQRRQLLPLSFCNMWLPRQNLEASTTSTFLLQYVALKAASRGVNYFHFPSAICGSQGSIQRRQLLPLSFCNIWLPRQHLEASTTSTFLLQYVALKAASRGVNYFHFPSAICGSQGSIQRRQLLPLSFCNMWLPRQHLEASTTSTFLLQYVALKAASRGVNYFHFPSAICGSQGSIQRRQLLPLSFCNMWLSRQHLEVSTTSTFLLQYVALKAASRGFNQQETSNTSIRILICVEAHHKSTTAAGMKLDGLDRCISSFLGS